MVTHDVDEALLLADRIVMMTNGPAATIGRIIDVPFAAPAPARGDPGPARLLLAARLVVDFLEAEHARA